MTQIYRSILRNERLSEDFAVFNGRRPRPAPFLSRTRTYVRLTRLPA
jgi:hypothetical protein